MKTFLVLMAMLLPSWTRAQTTTPNYTQTVQDTAKVSSCVQDVYARQMRGEEIRGGYMQALKDCYAGTTLESSAQFDPTPAIAIQVPEIPDGFVSPEARVQLQEAYRKITQNLTYEEAQKVTKCITGITAQHDSNEPPSAEEQRALAQCYRGTSFAPIADAYERIAVRVDCAYDSLGVSRVLEVVRTGNGTPREYQIIERCIIERTAAVAGSLTVLNALAAIGVRNAGALVYFLLLQPVLWFSMRRRDVQWGTVYNRLTNLPVDLSIVRLQERGRTVRTRVTDSDGRYICIVEPRPYTLSVNKPGFTPAEHVFVQAPQGVVNTDVPLDPIVREKSARMLFWSRVRQRTHRVVGYASPAVTVVGATLDPKPWVLAVSFVSIVITFVFTRKTARPRPSTFGVVFDSSTKRPISGAVVRLFSMPWNKLTDSARTNSRGQYAFLVGPGTYYVTVEKLGHENAQSREMQIAERTGWVAETVALTHVVSPAAQR